MHNPGPKRKRNGGSETATTASTSSDSFFQPRFEQPTPKVQKGLQTLLIRACLENDLASVKDLFNKGAKLMSTDATTGQSPLAAAIWGLSHPIIDYLEEKKLLDNKEDWINACNWLQEEYSSILPCRKEILTYQDLYNHYSSKGASFLYEVEPLISRTLKNYNPYYFITSMTERKGLTASIPGFSWIYTPSSTYEVTILETHIETTRAPVKTAFNAKDEISLVGSGQVTALNNLCNSMAKRLEDKGIAITPYFQIETATPQQSSQQRANP